MRPPPHQKQQNSIPYIHPVHVCVLSCFSCVQLCATLWTVPFQAPLSRGILQARILEWVATLFSRGSSWPRDWTHVSYVSRTARWVLYHECHLGSPYSSCNWYLKNSMLYIAFCLDLLKVRMSRWFQLHSAFIHICYYAKDRWEKSGYCTSDKWWLLIRKQILCSKNPFGEEVRI